jgi:hypothetical protein
MGCSKAVTEIRGVDSPLRNDLSARAGHFGLKVKMLVPEEKVTCLEEEVAISWADRGIFQDRGDENDSTLSKIHAPVGCVEMKGKVVGKGINYQVG